MKTKEAKQAEAVARNRAGFHQHRLTWLERQPGGELYEYIKKRYGKEDAEKRKEVADKVFKKVQEAAKVDSHGNPLEVVKKSIRIVSIKG